MKKYGLPLLIDVVLVVVFCLIGRRSHEESNAVTAILRTVWPFLGGLGAGWIATVALYRDKFAAELVIPTGVLVWFSTLVIGMALRVVNNQGTVFSFVVVAGTVLAIFLIGWRAIFRAFGKRGGTVVVHERADGK